jgi:hypothetical protein
MRLNGKLRPNVIHRVLALGGHCPALPGTRMPGKVSSSDAWLSADELDDSLD